MCGRHQRSVYRPVNIRKHFFTTWLCVSHTRTVYLRKGHSACFFVGWPGDLLWSLGAPWQYEICGTCDDRFCDKINCGLSLHSTVQLAVSAKLAYDGWLIQARSQAHHLRHPIFECEYVSLSKTLTEMRIRLKRKCATQLYAQSKINATVADLFL